MSDPVLLKFQAAMNISDREKEAISALLGSTVVFGAGKDMIEEGQRPSQCLVILEGLACRYRATPQGLRQILSFQMPGDWLDLHSYLLRTIDHSLRAISPCRVAQIPYERLDQLFDTHPHLMKALWRDTMIDSAVFREWVVNVGARDAPQRLAHLLCEVHRRMLVVGAASEHEFPFPVTQQELAEALGISSVHANRSLQSLRQEGLLQWKHGVVTVLQLDRLRQLADFDDTYLHIHEGPDDVVRSRAE